MERMTKVFGANIRIIWNSANFSRKKWMFVLLLDYFSAIFMVFDIFGYNL